ncbi:MAG: tRNA (pseudouridine(54)-N(1))-methyltransferase TrmY [Thermoplasmatales archaeon]|nr:tRNA (pseudouridine(54)-N(1))-methyltransferase TrmY [Thermoplasmatales archaeon]
MRSFIIIGHRVKTSGDFNLNDLCGSTGRLDVLLRCINAAFFVSNNIRRDVEVYLVLLGEPEPPKTIHLIGSELKYLNPDERSTGALTRNALMKNIGNEEIKSTPGIYVSKKNFEGILKDLKAQIIYLKEDGEDIRNADLPDNAVFVLGDEKDLTEDEEKTLEKHNAKTVSLGPVKLHASHCITIVNNEMDRRKFRETF